MANSKLDNEAREQRILDAASNLIVRQGYDKITMSDVAEEAGISRGIVYLHFDTKEKLFEALLIREITHYGETWNAYFESDPRSGTIGGIFRGVLHAINSRPLMTAIVRRDKRILGSYLHKPEGMLASLESSSVIPDLIKALQTAGTVRKDIDASVAAHIFDILSHGQLTLGDIKSPDTFPPFEVVMETLADMMDHWLTPEGGGNSEAGKAVLRQIGAAAEAQFEQMKQAKELNEGQES
ncbi:MAG: helix-turn-helix domain-containing protein [Chloroflexota bacterium]